MALPLDPERRWGSFFLNVRAAISSRANQRSQAVLKAEFGYAESTFGGTGTTLAMNLPDDGAPRLGRERTVRWVKIDIEIFTREEE